MLKISDSRRGKKVCKLRWQGHLRPFFYVYENAQTRKKGVKNQAILVENEENELLHQLSSGRIWVVQSLTFGINLSHFRNDLHNLQSRVVFETCHILLCEPCALDFQPLYKCILVALLWTIVCNHQILEVRKEQREC